MFLTKKARFILAAAETHFDQVIYTLQQKKLLQPRHTGVYMTIFEEWDREIIPVASFMLGDQPSRDRRSEITQNALEKAQRLHRHPAHISSWVSRDPQRKCYGGAIRAIATHETESSRLIISSSGFPEHGDEALNLLTGRELGWYSPIGEIIAASDNQLARELLAL